MPARGGFLVTSAQALIIFISALAILYYINSAYQILNQRQHLTLLNERVSGFFLSKYNNEGNFLADRSENDDADLMKNRPASDFFWVKRATESFYDVHGSSSSSKSADENDEEEDAKCEIFSNNQGVFSSHRYLHSPVKNVKRVKMKYAMPKYAYIDAMAKNSKEKNVKDIAKMSAFARRGIISERKHFRSSARRLITEKPITAEDGSKKKTNNNNKKKLRRIIGTHHKTGTALMRDVFDSISKEFDYNFLNVRYFEDFPYLQPPNISTMVLDADVILDYHFSKPIPTYFPIDGNDRYYYESSNDRTRKYHRHSRQCQSLTNFYGDSYRIIHLIRDPRDALVSGCLYHMQNPEDETWLREVRVGDEVYKEEEDNNNNNNHKRSGGGSSYLDSILRLKDNPAEALLAEIKIADDELRMLGLAAQDCEIDIKAKNVRLENFFDELDDILRFLEFPEESIEELTRIATQHDAKTWNLNETENNVHFTSENPARYKYIEAMSEEGFVNKTITYLRYALGYRDGEDFPIFDNEQ